MSTVIQAAHYAENELALSQDPIIRDMAAAMQGVPRETYLNGEGRPNWSFMKGAGDEYHRRGGKLIEHIGGPANAVLMVLAEWDEREPGFDYRRHRMAEETNLRPGTPEWAMLLEACRQFDEKAGA
jgi:hypothetical protein